MPIDISKEKFGEPLQAATPYKFRINSAKVSITKTEKLRLNLGLVVAEGESKGQTIFWSPFQAMYWDYNADDAKNINAVQALYMFLSQKLGLGLEELTAHPLPSHDKEHTSILEFLINYGVEAEVKWSPPKGEYEGRWELGRIIRPLNPGVFVPAGWEAFQGGSEPEGEAF